MASIDEIATKLGVKHTKENCPVCKVIEAEDE